MSASPTDAAGWRHHAAQCARRQDAIGAASAMARAQALAPSDRLIAFLHAQAQYEAGYPAADLFAHARRLWPDNSDALRNHALALASEGDPEGAEALLDTALLARPDWLEGQRILAGLRRTAGQTQGFDAAYARACAQRPEVAGLWLGWFGALAQTRDWAAARRVLAEACRHLGDAPPLAAAEAFLASETGDLAAAESRFAALGASGDPFVVIGRIRLALRQGRPEAVPPLAMPLLRSPVAGQLWPYLATAWRLLGDPRTAWLDGDPPFIAERDPGIAPAEIAALAELLRGLHKARAAYPEQSVRGGTQTDRSLLLRHEPLLQVARRKLMAAVQEVARALPPRDPAHPLLGHSLLGHPPLSAARENLRIAGSWSVRLTGAGGHNVAHSHPGGWLSAVFYVALPEGAAPPPAGALQLGAPPAELGLDLAPLRRVAPAVGRLVVFPSTLWHGTEPIAGGERLNIAFDVVPGAE